MRALFGISALALVGLLAIPAPANADVTAFWGFSSAPSTRSAKGFSLGVSLLVVGFEFEYANTSEDPMSGAPALRTGTVNALVQTPTTGAQIYLTAGGGFFREQIGSSTETGFGTNIGGGLKLGLAGPLRLRLDYRIFRLRGSPAYPTPHRFYAGLNLNF